MGELANFTAAQNGTTRYNFGLSYAADGNITSANDSQNGNWSYSYDPFNRLKTASQTGQAFQWDYDRYGNRWHQTVTQGSGGQSSLSFTGSNNHVDGETYDAAGNVTNVGTRTYTYDAENRLLTVGGDSTASYVYGADGQRVKTQAYEYLYDLDGNTIAMLNASTGANIYDEIYAGGRHLATYSSSTTSFNHNDWLGTERVRTGPTGTVAETCTNLPFGDGQTCTGPESSRIHFTGDEHDSETGLDHTLFRQYQSLEARWLSVDPLAGDISDPQSLNRYAYVQNDPMNSIDPLGLYVEGPCGADGSRCAMLDSFFLCALFGFCRGGPHFIPLDPLERGREPGPLPPPKPPKPPKDLNPKLQQRLKNCALGYYGIDPLSVTGLSSDAKWALIAAAAGGIPKAVPESLGMRVIMLPGASRFTSALSILSVAGGGGTLRTIANFGSKWAGPLAIASAVIDATAIGICTASD